jgi:D-xylose reductase
VTAFSSFGAAAYHEHGLATPEESTFKNVTIVEIAKNHSKSPAQVLLRWGVQRGTAVIPKSTNVERQLENAAIFDFNLSNSEMDQIFSLNKNRRFADVSMIVEQHYGTCLPLYE